MNGNIDCNSKKIRNIVGSIDYYRIQRVCSLKMKNFIALTDQYGRATFTEFQLISGPVGRYGFKFTTTDPDSIVNITTNSFYTYIESEVYLILLKFQKVF